MVQIMSLHTPTDLYTKIYVFIGFMLFYRTELQV